MLHERKDDPGGSLISTQRQSCDGTLVQVAWPSRSQVPLTLPKNIMSIAAICHNYNIIIIKRQSEAA